MQLETLRGAGRWSNSKNRSSRDNQLWLGRRSALNQRRGPRWQRRGTKLDTNLLKSCELDCYHGSPLKSIHKKPFLRGNDVGSTFTEVTSIAPQAPAIGIFYDDPSITAPDDLRSIIGCLVREKIGETDERILANDEQVQILTERGFKIFTLPSIEMAVLTDFVYTTPFSLWLASGRVFSRLRHYIDERNLCAYPFIEFYKDCRVFYAAPLSKQEDFFVEECHKIRERALGANHTSPYGTTLSCYTSPHAPCSAIRHLMGGCYTSCLTVKDLNSESESSSFEEIDDDTLRRKSSVAEGINKKID
uniref:Uncharacterized protein n=1 Tax=Romanomermis culicivorax TaxID=13658 RepID=A0A915K1B8_ROMCU